MTRVRVAAALAPTPAAPGRRTAVGNLVALGLALACVTAATLAIARLAGPAVVGDYALLRLLPWLTGVVLSVGLPVASTFHLAALSSDERLRPTLAALAAAGAVLGVLAWTLAVPLLHDVLFAAVPPGLLLLSGATVATQLLTVWGKACCQGVSDIRGANIVIVGEEFLFLPVYGMALLAGLGGLEAVVAGLLGGGLASAVLALGRNAALGFFRGWGRPSVPLARSVVGYGARGQLGDLLWLVNLRLDFLILGALAGPAALGGYAIASKFAELLRLPATAVNYVLYPRFAGRARGVTDAEVLGLARHMCLLTAVLAPLVCLAAVFVLPLLYGSAFGGTVVLACILLLGLAPEGAAAVSSAYLRGVGRPGTNSLAMAVGVVITVSLDLLLIPSEGARGAAIASSAAYLVTTALLVVLTYREVGRGRSSSGTTASGGRGAA